MTLNLPMTIPNRVISSTSKVWEILVASKNGNISKVKELAAETPELVYAQYNYTPPIHFAVREGHTMLVEYLLDEGAHDPNYKIYPFLDSLTTLAEDRGLTEIVSLLNHYAADNSNQKFKGDNGEIHYDRTSLQNEFQDMVDKQNYERVKEILNQHPDFAKDETYFWGGRRYDDACQNLQLAIT